MKHPQKRFGGPYYCIIQNFQVGSLVISNTYCIQFFWPNHLIRHMPWYKAWNKYITSTTESNVNVITKNLCSSPSISWLRSSLSFGESSDWVEFGKGRKVSQIINEYTLAHCSTWYLFYWVWLTKKCPVCPPPPPPSKGKMMSKWEAFFVHAVVSVIKERRPRAYVQKWCVHRFRCPNMVALRATGGGGGGDGLFK
jgi:hypothetical protein